MTSKGKSVKSLPVWSPAPAQRDALQAEGFCAGVGGITGCPLTTGGQVGGGAVAGPLVVANQVVPSRIV